MCIPRDVCSQVLVSLPELWWLDCVQPLWDVPAATGASLPRLSEMHPPHGPPLSLVRRRHLSMSLCIDPLSGAQCFSIISHRLSSNVNSTQPCSPLFVCRWWLRINNCVGELNQKYFIQFLFYTGEYFQYVHINAALILQPCVILGLSELQSLPVLQSFLLFKMC